MSEALQWIAVAIVVAAAAVYLYRRLFGPKRGNDCGCRCGSCPLGADYAAKCEKARQDAQGNLPRTSC